jgi:hypothetical protein
MSVLERAKAHFDKQDIIEITVPEWEDENGNPTVLYSKPLTLADKKKLFDIGDKITLLNSVDPNVLTRIAGKMTEAKSVEDFEGN